jgi:hypothetical protein
MLAEFSEAEQQQLIAHLKRLCLIMERGMDDEAPGGQRFKLRGRSAARTPD